MRTRPGMRNHTNTAPILFSSAILCLAVALGACSESTNGATSQQGGTGNSGNGGAMATSSGGANSSNVGGAVGEGGAVAAGPGVWATINVNLIDADATVPAHSTIGAFGKDSAPLPELFSVAKTVGDCKLLEPTYVLCDTPPCASTEGCVATNKCQKTPLAVAMGNLKFGGLTLVAGGTAFTLSPVNTSYQAAGDTAIAHPPCTAGGEVTVTGGADATTAFSLKTSCIDTLELTGANPVPFEPNKAAQFTWAAPTAGTARIAVRIDISHHGGLKGLIVCDTADTGSLQVDASLVTGLIGLGTAGYPVVRLTRVNTVTVAAGSGKATLNVQSPVERPLAIPGVTSCSDDTECTGGKSCVSLKCQ
jgi:hypothetical protein